MDKSPKDVKNIIPRDIWLAIRSQAVLTDVPVGEYITKIFKAWLAGAGERKG